MLDAELKNDISPHAVLFRPLSRERVWAVRSESRVMAVYRWRPSMGGMGESEVCYYLVHRTALVERSG